MLDIRNPGRFAASLEAEIERLARFRAVGAVPPALDDLAEALERLARILREAESLGQSVTVADGVLRVVAEFRGALRALGTAAEA